MDICDEDFYRSVVIVAHPDDETIWAGGTILRMQENSCFVLSLCRGGDVDRKPRFFRAVKQLGVTGKIMNMDDSPNPVPLDGKDIRETILTNLPQNNFDLIITHSPMGEYTRNIRHEEMAKAVLDLWISGDISSKELYLFAYEDGGHCYLPRPIKEAPVYTELTELIWRKKYSIIRDIYGFDDTSFEALTTPRAEAFWKITNKKEARDWLNKKYIDL